MKMIKMKEKTKGQIFTADFVIAVSVLVIGLGAILQSSELGITSASNRISISSSLSDPLAAMIVENKTFIAPNPYCASYSNGTTFGECTNFNCDFQGGNTFITQRLIPCESATNSCTLTVFTCQ